MWPDWTTFFAVLININKFSLWISALSLDETTSPGNTCKHLPQAILLQIWHMTVVFHRCSLIRAGYFHSPNLLSRAEKTCLWWCTPSRWSVTWHRKEKYSVCWPNRHLQRLSHTRKETTTPFWVRKHLSHTAPPTVRCGCADLTLRSRYRGKLKVHLVWKTFITLMTFY